MNKLKETIKSYDKTVAKEDLQITGVLGLAIGGSKVVEVPNRNSFVYVRLRDNLSEVIQVFNEKVSPSYELPVIIVRRGNRYEILGRDTQRYNDWGDYSAYLPRHGHTHEMDIEGGGFGDPVFIYSRQFMPCLLFPSGTAGASDVLMAPYTLKNPDNSWRYVGLTGTPNLTPLYNPPTGSQAVMVTIYLDAYTGNPGILVGSGSYFSETITGTPNVLPYTPTVTNPMHIPLGAIRLVTGSLALSWDNIYDLRQFLHPTPTGSAGGGLGSVALYNTGSSVGNVTSLDFQSPLYVGITGTRGYPSIRDITLKSIEDVTAQIPTGTPTTHFTTTGTMAIGTENLYYNGVRQKYPQNYLMDANGKGFTTLFTGTYGDNLVIEYGNLGTNVPNVTVQDIRDEGISLGNPTVYDYVGNMVDVSVSGSIARITSPSTGSYGSYSPYVSGTSNIQSLSANTFYYTRQGDIVDVTGILSLDPSGAPVYTTIYISLPIPTNLTNQYDIVGLGASAVNGNGAIIRALVGGGSYASFECTPTSVNTAIWGLHFTYRVK